MVRAESYSTPWLRTVLLEATTCSPILTETASRGNGIRFEANAITSVFPSFSFRRFDHTQFPM